MQFYSDFLFFRIFFPSALALLNVREVKSLRYVAMVAKRLDFNKLWQKNKKMTCMGFLCMIALKQNHKTVVHKFLPTYENANGRLCQERLLR